MSGEDVELFRQWSDAYNRWDTDWMLEHAADDVVFEPLRAATEGAYLGHDGMRAFFKDNAESFERVHGEITEVHDLGDRVLGLGTITIKGRESGIEMDVPTASISRFCDGLLVEFKDYGDHQRAREAAGLA
jgi:ketosteroid isomerase-like protein